MATIQESALTVNFDRALRTAAEKALTRYAGEAERITRGLVLALNGAVTLQKDGTASVQSGSNPEISYTVNGHCDCHDAPRAQDGRCKHRYAKALVKKALDLIAIRRFYATYTAPDGTAHQGIATATDRGWLFVADDGGIPLYAALQALALGGNCAIAEAKRAEEEAAGGLAAIVCGYGK